MPQNTPHSYGSIARCFHWLTALIILANIGLGLVAVRLPMEALETTVAVFSLHKTLGIAAFAVALARILWALSCWAGSPPAMDRAGGRPFPCC